MKRSPPALAALEAPVLDGAGAGPSAATPPAAGGPPGARPEAFFAQTRLPTEYGDFDVRVLVDADGLEHVALSVGELAGARDVHVRVHSECMTSEVFGSLKCDCRDQLEAALASIQAAGQGVVLYLRQEGRGIGLGNKIRAYQLQAEGADTVDANRLLGFADDLRSYEVAGEMLAALGVRSVRLITNNPSKIDGLAANGVEVVGRLPLVAGVNTTNHGYLETKRQRMGHLYATPAPEAEAGQAPEAEPAPDTEPEQP